MSDRETILQRVHQRLAAAGPFRASFAPAACPPAPDLWPPAGDDRGAMIERFAKELRDLGGELLRLRGVVEAQQQLPALIEQEGWSPCAALDTPLLRESLAAAPAERIAWLDPSIAPVELALLPAAFIEADALLADTGSCVLRCRTSVERLSCYLPPTCLVVARLEQMEPNLPAYWQRAAADMADPAARGETVIVSGPSRTSDIEKVLVLGVHGPQRLIVVLLA